MVKIGTLMAAANIMIIASALLVAMNRLTAALLTAAIGCVGLMAGGLIGAWLLPRRRLPSAEESAGTGVVLVIVSCVLIALALAFIAVDVLVAGVVFLMAAFATATLAAGKLRAARMLRLVPELIACDDEPRAVALSANGMPGTALKLVVSVADRIAWAEGRHLSARHTLRLADVDRFDVDHRRGTLSVAGPSEAVRVRPVAKRELEQFERFLLAAKHRL